MLTYFDVINNGIVGDIRVYWGDDALIKGVHFALTPDDSFSVPGDLSVSFPLVYSFLSNTGSSSSLKDMSLLDLSGYTKFHIDIYSALCLTELGETITYGELAARAGYPGAARAAGSAMRKNKFPLLIPCHRVVASNGPGSYSMGGLRIKLALMEMEKADGRTF